MATRFQPLMAMTARVRPTSSSSLKCSRTRAYSSSGTWWEAIRVKVSAHSSADELYARVRESVQLVRDVVGSDQGQGLGPLQRGTLAGGVERRLRPRRQAVEALLGLAFRTRVL